MYKDTKGKMATHYYIAFLHSIGGRKGWEKGFKIFNRFKKSQFPTQTYIMIIIIIMSFNIIELIIISIRILLCNENLFQQLHECLLWP